MKPIVHYEIHKDNYIIDGYSAIIKPIDHPSGLVSNESFVQTTNVKNYNETDHTFETENTFYQGVHTTQEK